MGVQNLHLSALEVACNEVNRALQSDLLLVVLRSKIAQTNYRFLVSSDSRWQVRHRLELLEWMYLSAAGLLMSVQFTALNIKNNNFKAKKVSYFST